MVPILPYVPAFCILLSVASISLAIFFFYNKKSPAAVAVFLGVATAAITIVITQPLLELEFHGVVGAGTVISTHCNIKYVDIEYNYDVNLQTYAKHSHGGYGIETCNDLKRNGAVLITYLQDDPAGAILGKPEGQIISQLLRGLIAGVVFTVAIYSLAKKRAK